MAPYDGSDFFVFHSIPCPPALVVFWLTGLTCGMFLSLYAGTPILSMMRGILYDSVSIVSLVVTGLIPFLFTAYAVFISKPRLVLAVCFLKAYLLSFVSTEISAAFASAGWLVRSLILLHNSAVCVMLHLLWIRVLSGRKVHWFIISIGIVVASVVSFYIISPLLACLIEQ